VRLTHRHVFARRAYRIGRPNERNTSFRRQEFLDALRNNRANDLYNIVSGQYFQDMMTLLYELRNTIHGAGLSTLAFISGVEPQASFVTVLPKYRDSLWEAAERCGSPEQWGLTRINGIQFEPYVLFHRNLDKIGEENVAVPLSW